YEDDFGQVSSYLNRNSQYTAYGLDSDTGNLIGTAQFNGSEELDTSYSYTDCNDGTFLGLVKSITDPAGNVTEYSYYSDGLVKDVIHSHPSFTDPVTVQHYEYDERDRIASSTDARGNTTSYVYDHLDRLIQRTDPDPDGSGEDYPLQSPVW